MTLGFLQVQLEVFGWLLLGCPGRDNCSEVYTVVVVVVVAVVLVGFGTLLWLLFCGMEIGVSKPSVEVFSIRN